jgi:hypothetical protein
VNEGVHPSRVTNTRRRSQAGGSLAAAVPARGRGAEQIPALGLVVVLGDDESALNASWTWHSRVWLIARRAALGV